MIGIVSIGVETVKNAAARGRAATTRLERTGLVLDWFCTGLAALIAIGGLAATYFDQQHNLAIAAVFGVAAALAWVLGKALRFILAGSDRKQSSPE